MSYFTEWERPNPNNFKIHNMIYANMIEMCILVGV